MELSANFGVVTNIVIAVPTVALVLLWLIFKFYLRDYEMDFKSLLVISYKIFGAFAIISFFPLPFLISASFSPSVMYMPLAIAAVVSFFIARRLFMKSGMEKEETQRVIVPWFVLMFILSVAAASVLIFSERPAAGNFDTKQETVFYIKPASANVRSCPSTSCEVIAGLSQNSTYTTSKYSSLDEMPEWVSIAYADTDSGEKISGYINKAVLSKFPVE